MKNIIKNSVIGYPLEHSFSTVLHGPVYHSLGIEADIVKDADDNIANLVDRIKNTPYELTAVTMPHKQSIINYLDEVDGVAKEIGAVNTVINKNGKLTGYNTDVYGIEYALRNVEIKNKNVLIVGAGGVARPVAYFVGQAGGKSLFVNRTIEKAESLAKDFGGLVVDVEELESEDVDIIINTTPVGMYPNIEESPVPKDFLRDKHIVFDIIYNPIETKLLKDVKSVGAEIISGLDMFIAQGIRQIELWQGVEIDIEKYFDKLKKLLSNNLIPKT